MKTAEQAPIVDADACLTCRACVGICPANAIRQRRREIEIDHSLCDGCGICVSWCPANAIYLGRGGYQKQHTWKKAPTPEHLRKSYGLIVVGAGIAGLSTAKAALQANPRLKVLVIEKKRKVGEDVNSSAGIWPFTLEMLSLTPEERSGVVLQEFTKFGVAAEKDSACIDIGKVFSLTIDLSRLLAVLSKKITALGGQVETNTFVRDVVRTRGGFSLGVIANGVSYKLKTNLLADASGIDSVVSRKLGIFKNWDPRAIGVGAEYETTWTGDAATAWLIVRKYKNLGYGWSFPIGDGKARVGIGALLGSFRNNKILLHDELDEFIKTHPLIKKNTGTNASRINFKCGAYPMWKMADKLIWDNAIRVGDAASQANPLIGEGIYYSVKYGQKAGEVLARCKDGKESEFREYEKLTAADRKKFERDKMGFEVDYDSVIRRLKELGGTLSDGEKTALLSFFLPFEASQAAKIQVAVKLIGYRNAIRLFGKLARKQA